MRHSKQLSIFPALLRYMFLIFFYIDRVEVQLQNYNELLMRVHGKFAYVRGVCHSAIQTSENTEPHMYMYSTLPSHYTCTVPYHHTTHVQYPTITLHMYSTLPSHHTSVSVQYPTITLHMYSTLPSHHTCTVPYHHTTHVQHPTITPHMYSTLPLDLI